MGVTCLFLRICDAALAGRFYVWLSVPEWMQSCNDQKMQRATQKASRYHLYGRMQPGKEPDSGRGNKGTTLNEHWLIFYILSPYL